ncbi:MAG TPA: tetratricopeptide repeat protein, partial [Gemmataceae bacterium]|nr:tetratricopeptide repeat protein [Gemmataceae bacterium]
LRLLLLEDAERPDDPFTLFNLGSVYQELGRHAEALPALRRSLERSHPRDSIVRKLYALLVQCHRKLGQQEQARAACGAGRGLYPEDAELLFQEAELLRQAGDRAGAVRALRRVLEEPEGAHFASLDTGVTGYKARHNLAVLLREEGQPAEAEAHWRAAVAEQPSFVPGWLGLAELYLADGCWPELEGIARHLVGEAGADMEADVLRARGHLARQEFADARRLLERVIARFPGEVWPRVILSHVLLQEGKDWEAAEQALRDVLALQPGHAEARRNLAVLLRQRGKPSDASWAEATTLAALYAAACRTPSDIHEHLPALYDLASRCRHVTEFGTRLGVSTTALLFAQPEELVCYDLQKYPQVDRLRALAGRTRFHFHQTDVLRVEIAATDLLFIDTRHDYDQLKEELRRHAGQVRRYVVLHDTTTYGDKGETPGHRGLWPAVEEFLAQRAFRLQERYTNNHGLAVLEAVSRAEE